jgi:hypothetical protein
VEDAQLDTSVTLRRSARSTVFNSDNGKVWTEAYVEPGQYVFARVPPSEDKDGRSRGEATTTTKAMPTLRLPIARSPYHVRYDSARYDSAKIEFLVDAREHSPELAALKPGDRLYVSEPHGKGFSNVLFGERDLEAAMRKNHPLVMVAASSDGVASIRAMLDWQPVMAYADQHPVCVFYLCESQESAAFVALHDEWRSEGFKIIPCYGDLDEQLFMIEQCVLTGAEHAGGKPTILGVDPTKPPSILLAGAKGDVAKRLLDLFDARGVSRDNILTSDFYEPHAVVHHAPHHTRPHETTLLTHALDQPYDPTDPHGPPRTPTHAPEKRGATTPLFSTRFTSHNSSYVRTRTYTYVHVHVRVYVSVTL